MKTLVIAILIWVLPAAGMALPAEDHWSVEMDPDVAAAFEQSVALIEREEFTEALPILKQLADDLPGNADVFNMLGFALRKTGDLERSGAFYQRALYLDPNHIGALEYQGELFLMQGNIEAALDNLRRLNTICQTPCEERDELDEAIRAWQNK